MPYERGTELLWRGEVLALDGRVYSEPGRERGTSTPAPVLRVAVRLGSRPAVAPSRGEPPEGTPGMAEALPGMPSATGTSASNAARGCAGGERARPPPWALVGSSRGSPISSMVETPEGTSCSCTGARFSGVGLKRERGGRTTNCGVGGCVCMYCSSIEGSSRRPGMRAAGVTHALGKAAGAVTASEWHPLSALSAHRRTFASEKQKLNEAPASKFDRKPSWFSNR